MKVTVPYFGALSVNRYKIHGTYRTRAAVELWMKKLGDEVRELQKEERLTPPITVVVWGRFSRVHPDMDNLGKVICDGVKQGLDIDDKYFKYAVLGYSMGSFHPELDIYISRSLQ